MLELARWECWPARSPAKPSVSTAVPSVSMVREGRRSCSSLVENPKVHHVEATAIVLIPIEVATAILRAESLEHVQRLRLLIIQLHSVFIARSSIRCASRRRW
eukprot:scaffold1534_cov267-Pinguiococcus_pyrenoidosus.AAC.26